MPACGRLLAGGHPPVQVGQSGAKQGIVVHTVERQLAPYAVVGPDLYGRKVTGAVLATCKVVPPDVGRLRRVLHGHQVRVDERRVAAPVLRGCVDKHNLGDLSTLLQALQHGPFRTGYRVYLVRIREREQLGDNEANILGGLAKAKVELAPHGPGNVGNNAVQGHPFLLVFVQARVNHLAQETAALGTTNGVGVVNCVGQWVASVGVGILNERDRIPDHGKSQAYDTAPLGGVDQLVYLAGLKPGRHVYVAGFLTRFAFL